MHIDMTMRRPDGVSPAAGDPIAHMLTLAALMPRQDVEAAIDAMIAALDAGDGDADDEENGDAEGFTAPDGFHLRRMVTHLTDDHEQDDEPEEDGEDCCSAADDDPSRRLTGCQHDDPDIEAGTWEHHGERQPDTIHLNHQRDDDEADDPAARLPHRDRIRRTRCNSHVRWGETYFTLRSGFNGRVL